MFFAEKDILLRFLASKYLRMPKGFLRLIEIQNKILPEEFKRAVDNIGENLKKGTGKDLKKNKYRTKRENIGINKFLPLKIDITEEKEKGYLYVETILGKSSVFFGIKHLLNYSYKILQNIIGSY